MLKAQVLIPGLGRSQVLAPGMLIYDFRGDTHEFVRATRLAGNGRSGKVEVLTKGRPAEYYDGVFPGLEVIETED